MEDARFDTLARKIGVLTTRRTTLAAAVGAALGVLGWAESEAAKSGACKQQCPECQRCKQGKCKKRHGKKHCKQDRRQPQPAGAACSLGSGRGGCCDGRCLDLKTDKANCGTCGNACGATQVCQDGTCFSTNSCLATVTGLCSSGFSVPCGEGAGPG